MPTEQDALHLKSTGRFTEAAEIFTQLIKQNPKNHVHLYNLGNTHLAANRPADAIDPFRRAIRAAPRFFPAHNNLGLALLATGQNALAAASFTRAASLNPINPAPRHLAGHALLRLNNPTEALPHLKEANRLAPNQPAILTDLADALRRTGALLEVAPLARQAAALAPDRIEAWNNLANAERDIAAYEAAEHASERALSLDPTNAEAHYNLALTLLTAGKLAEAWPHWEYRWQGVVGATPRFSTPPWDGTQLEGTLYLHAEQGLGDTIQFARYAPLAAARATRVILAAQPLLLPLLRTLQAEIELADLNAPPPEFAAHAPLLSLPRAFATTPQTIPTTTPYLSADPAKSTAWKARVTPLSGLKVGLVWAGNPDFPFDHARSIPPALLAPLAAVPGVTFISLQVAAKSRPPLNLIDYTADLHDFADTAALLSALDLIISVDTATLHLAGALGRPAWLLNRYASDWRWNTTWYPTIREFRQANPGQWKPVIAQITTELTNHARAGGQPPAAGALPRTPLGSGTPDPQL
jgi:Flp pilus assembly protein TadD